MSLDLVKWAYAQDIGKSSTKFVLVTMALQANPLFYASIDTLISHTGLNRKTVQQALRELKLAGLIEPTGRKKGGTGKVIEYRFSKQAEAETGPKSVPFERNIPLSYSQTGPKTDPLRPKKPKSYPQIGPKTDRKQAQIRASDSIDNINILRARVDPHGVDNSTEGIDYFDGLKMVLQ